MIFPNCEKLGQTIIFVRTRETARALHQAMARDGYKCTSIQARAPLRPAARCGSCAARRGRTAAARSPPLPANAPPPFQPAHHLTILLTAQSPPHPRKTLKTLKKPKNTKTSG